MIDKKKLDHMELADIVLSVQKKKGITFGFDEIVEILNYTIRKAEINGKGEAYVPILFENELADSIMRREINLIGRMNECALNVTAALV